MAKTEQNKKKRILLVAGGTGGHISPALALMQELMERGWSPILLVGQRDRRFPFVQEWRDERGQIDYYNAPRIPAMNFTLLWRGWPFALRFVRAYLYAAKLIKEKKVAAVVGFGGYVSAPALWAGRRVPRFLCEQNSYMGLVNRLWRQEAKRIYTAFPLEEKVDQEKVVLAGNPVRREAHPDFYRQGKERERIMSQISPSWRSWGESFWDKHDEKPIILILGGSQGAHYLNQWALGYVAANAQVRLLILAGTNVDDKLHNQWRELSKEQRERVLILGFVAEMAPVYAVSNLAVARSGGSVYELASWAIPAVLVPYPFAADAHQERNAEFFYKKYGLPVCRQDEGAECLQQSVESLLPYQALYRTIRQNLEKGGFGKAAAIMATDIQQNIIE